MLVNISICLLFAILGGVVNAKKSRRTSWDGAGSFSGSCSSGQSSSGHSSSSSYSSSSVSVADKSVEDKCDRNSTYKRCPNPCPKTCANPDGVSHCYKLCETYGCECNPGYVVSEKGKCVKLEDCSDYSRCNDANATFKQNPNPCPGTCDFPGGVICNKAGLKEGCECKQGFYLNDELKCVALQDCPGAKTCSCNETFVYCYVGCPNNECPTRDEPGIIACDPIYPCRSGCACKKDYLRSADNKCILYSDCPAINCIGPNEEYSARPPPCLFEDCTDIGKPNQCDRTYPNRPQCICKPGFYRNSDRVCVPENECGTKACGLNEVLVDCMTVCPPQSCKIAYTDYVCLNTTSCKQGCDCLPNYLRNDSDICIPSDDCPPPQQCDISPECRPTCANPKPNCCLADLPENVMENQDGCQCRSGYILSDTNGACIPIDSCPDEGCNGDPNSIVVVCPWAFPSTCELPNAGSYGHDCDTVGCQCKSGFILSEEGKCILPEDCKNGYPCGANETFSDCAFPCPNQYCPENDSQMKVACKPGRPCPSGCVCKPYYLRRSYEDETCVLASDCTPVICTRCNEKYNPCASECLAERCVDLYTKLECYPDPENCQPQCDCIDGYYRDTNGFCVPKEDCPINCEVQQECRPTCAVPNPPNCPFIPPADSNVDSCNCQPGYVLSEVGGTCIKIDECPASQSCNGDSNATIKECPLPCPSTCESPNATPCKRKCDPIGCECNPGYLKSENGTCVLPNDCEGGNPCGKNETFTPCRYICPTNYCPKDDSRAVVVCETYPFAPCFSGCSCRLSYRLLSREKPICILSSECPSVNCTRKDEEFNSCPSECDSEYCDAVDKAPSVCNPLIFNCNPRCVCKKTYFRNDAGMCVSSDECRRLNKEKEVPTSE